ncbi:DMT family transporter [Insolitispirillum peregrinum]|uniref:Uncharacterized membrane protein n=1 Tax=Insolitispirillum peregrinum TaxID=80876 RepID=A0A1N7PJ16_9PROT|nr:DMT family transporter [Insolitispirillum peregrinum]SIT10643.1 Uncharacterized membrane protein [Insolitispirillum peregrinum]
MSVKLVVLTLLSLLVFAGNFIRAAPIALALFAVMFTVSTPSLDGLGVVYGLLSGGITSGLGYILWYAALKELNVTHAATVQLSVPVITAFGGALFLGEAITQVLAIASVAIVVGIALVVLVKKKPVPAPAPEVEEGDESAGDALLVEAGPALAGETSER